MSGSAPSGVATFLFGSIDSFLSTFVTTTSAAVASGIAPLVVTGMTIWVATYGLAVMRNEVADPVMVFAKNIIRVSFIFAIALTGGVYQSFVVDGVNAMQNGFVTAVAPNSAGNIAGVIDTFDQQASDLGMQILSHGMTLMPWGGGLDVIAGLLVLTASAILELVAMGFTCVAKVAIAFMMGIGPFFIVALAFPVTQKYFDAWVGKVMNYLFLVVGLAVTLTMSVAICTAYVSHFTQNLGDTQNISDAFGLVAVEGALLILAWQMPLIASGLGGGASLSGGGVGAFIGGFIGSKLGVGQKGGTPKGGGGGGAIQDAGGGSGGEQRRRSVDRVPAYRRATRDRLEERNE